MIICAALNILGACHVSFKRVISRELLGLKGRYEFRNVPEVLSTLIGFNYNTI